jgi:hypothetical protein
VIDYVFIGFVPMIFGAWPKTKSFILKDEILLKSPIHGLKTNIEHNLFFNHIRNRTSFFNELIVSNNWLLIKITLLTCLPPINNKTIKSYRFSRGLLGKRIELSIENGKKNHLSFRTKEKDRLVGIFNKIGIKEQTS